MKYVALLRGINVGGNRKVDMKKLTALFEELGFTNVKTYINSGNILFDSTSRSIKSITKNIADGIEDAFGFPVATLVLTHKDLCTIASKVPANWTNDKKQKTDVAFLFPSADSKATATSLPIKYDFIDVHYTPGALFWNVSRANQNKSQLNKLVAAKVYQEMTVRNINTVRKLTEL